MNQRTSSAYEDEWLFRRRGGAVSPGQSRTLVARFEEELFKRRGGASSSGSESARRSSGVSSPGLKQAAPRLMVERLEGIAKGGQPAVVKMASYGAGARFGAMVNYVSRSGQIALETDRGERLHSREDLRALRDEWEPLFKNRAESRDIAVFTVSVDVGSVADSNDMHGLVRTALSAGLGDRHYAYSLGQSNGGKLAVTGVAVLRSGEGERLTGDAKAATIVRSRSEAASPSGVVLSRFAFTEHGNGVSFGTAKLRNLVASDGDVTDDRGRSIRSEDEAAHLVQREWRPLLHSKTSRDVMHVVLSARAGTDTDAFENAARDFLAQQFEGFRYAFAMHDPRHDPKDEHQGGKRPHVHVHALVVMRNEHGDMIRTSPQVFRQWRALLAEKARDHGISMEMTDRREFAAAPAFTRHQVRAVDSVGRTRHVGTSEAGQRRYDAKRMQVRTVATSERSLAHAFKAKQAWSTLAERTGDDVVVGFAQSKQTRLSVAIRSSLEGLVASVDRGEFASEYDAALRQVADIVQEGNTMNNDLTRPEFEQYEKNVAVALANYEATIDPDDREQFERITQRAQEVVEARRTVLELQENLEKLHDELRPNSIAQDLASVIAAISPISRAAEIVKEADAELAISETGVVPNVAEAVEESDRRGIPPLLAEQADSPEATKSETGAMPNVSEAAVGSEVQASRSLPAEIVSQYYLQHAGDGAVRIFTNAKATREVFQDAGEKLRSKTYDPVSVRLMIDTAAHRGWTTVDVAGSKEFKREAWIEGQAHGIAVKGYQPNELDWQEVSRREQAYLKNEIRHVEEKIVATEAKDRSELERGAVTAASAIEPATKAERHGFRDGVHGILIEQGSKPYQGKADNEVSPYVVLKTDDGDRTVWGVGIPDALLRADAREGDAITLREEGMEKVEKAIIKDVDGTKVRIVQLVDRRKWEAEVTSSRDDKSVGAETSNGTRVVVEEKMATRGGDASTTEPAAKQMTRLEEQARQQQHREDRDDQER